MTHEPQPALAEAQTQYENAGLPFPPIPAHFVDHIETIAPWVYGTRPGESELYYLDNFVNEVLAGSVGDYVQFGHSGRGTNSWAIHYYLVNGPLALFIQVGWGGALTEPEDNALAANRLAQLMPQAGQLIHSVEQATMRGSLRPGQRLVVVISTFYDSQWLVLNAPIQPGANIVLPWHEARYDRLIPELITFLNTETPLA